MNKTNAKNKDQYESPVVLDVKPVSSEIVRGDEGSGPQEGDTDWGGE